MEYWNFFAGNYKQARNYVLILGDVATSVAAALLLAGHACGGGARVNGSGARVRGACVGAENARGGVDPCRGEAREKGERDRKVRGEREEVREAADRRAEWRDLIRAPGRQRLLWGWVVAVALQLIFRATSWDRGWTRV